MKKQNEYGFGLSVVILIIVILGVVSLTGYLIINSRNNKANTHVATKNSSTNTPTAPKKQSFKTTITKSESQSPQQYLTIKEWDVKIPLSVALQGLRYSVITYSDGGQSIGFTFSSLQNTSCNEDNSVGSLIRFTANETDSFNNMNMNSEYPNTPHIGMYYYAAQFPQGACSEDTATQGIVTGARQPLGYAINQIQAL